MNRCSICRAEAIFRKSPNDFNRSWSIYDGVAPRSRSLASLGMTFQLWVPGRIEFLGKHTDYAGGRSLLCPADRGIRLTATRRNDALVRVTDAKLRETV